MYFVLYFSCIYLAGMKNVATTACVPCTVLITNGKRKSTEQTCFYIVPIELLPHCHTL